MHRIRQNYDIEGVTKRRSISRLSLSKLIFYKAVGVYLISSLNDTEKMHLRETALTSLRLCIIYVPMKLDGPFKNKLTILVVVSALLLVTYLITVRSAST